MHCYILPQSGECDRLEPARNINIFADYYVVDSFHFYRELTFETSKHMLSFTLI